MGLKSLAKATHLSEIKVVYRAGLAADFEDGVNFDIFTVAGGAVEVYAMFGRCVTAFAAAGAAIPQIEFTTVVPAATVPLSGAAGTLVNDPIDTIYVWSGLAAGALAPTASLGIAGTAEMPWAGDTILLSEGVMRITNAVANADGVIDWYVAYVPCTIGAQVIPM